MDSNVYLRMCPVLVAWNHAGQRPRICACRSVCTNTYQLNILEAPSGVKIVLNTDPGIGNIRHVLERFYRELYVSLAVKDPMHQAGQVIEGSLFEEEVDAFFRKTGLL
jgi:trafficking protein particle complex subunit 1